MFEQADEVDELVRDIDRLCDRREWDAVAALRDRAFRAHEQGHQHWPAANYAAYRLALEAPGELAAAALGDERIRFTLGPLPEVAASGHRWTELAPHLTPGPTATVTAHERVIRGDDLSSEPLVDDRILDIPARVAAWEPAYPVATYFPDRIEAPRPELPRAGHPVAPSGASANDDPVVVDALRALVSPWVEQSDGSVATAAVTGDAAAAVTATTTVRAALVQLDGATAMALMAWAAASGGTHGRRRGAAAGRAATWWALRALTGVEDGPPDELAAAAAELEYYCFEIDEPDTGWTLRLAVEDPLDGLAWAINATDSSRL